VVPATDASYPGGGVVTSARGGECVGPVSTCPATMV
ncbi:unnamed protein product, partial [Urochloa humidicola]